MAKAKVVILSIGIALIVAFFFGYGISTFYESPKHKNFCREGEFQEPVARELVTTVPLKANCSYIEPDKSLRIKCTEKEGIITAKYDKDGCTESYYCEMCYKEFGDAREVYNKHVFIISIILGIIALAVGVTLKLPSVSSGIMGGGVLTIIYGTLRYWGQMPDYTRFIILGITLVILIWVGYKKLKK